jgi:1,4-dihydroxy-6-naphthoate synthase
LGGIIALRTLDTEILNKINRVLKRSVAFAMENPKSGIDFIRCHAQEMSEEVMYKHIHLYVNDFSRNLGEIGKAAVNRLFQEGKNLGLIRDYREDLYVE